MVFTFPLWLFIYLFEIKDPLHNFCWERRHRCTWDDRKNLSSVKLLFLPCWGTMVGTSRAISPANQPTLFDLLLISMTFRLYVHPYSQCKPSPAYLHSLCGLFAASPNNNQRKKQVVNTKIAWENRVCPVAPQIRWGHSTVDFPPKTEPSFLPKSVTWIVWTWNQSLRKERIRWCLMSMLEPQLPHPSQPKSPEYTSRHQSPHRAATP